MFFLKSHLIRSSGVVSPQYSASLAEAGTLQLEFQYLSDITGNSLYAEKALYALDQIHAIPRDALGLYADKLSVMSLKFEGENFGIGGGSDSFYEYLLKLWISTGSEKYRKMYDEAVEVRISDTNSIKAIAVNLTKTSQDSAFAFFPDRNLETSAQAFHHLVR